MPRRRAAAGADGGADEAGKRGKGKKRPERGGRRKGRAEAEGLKAAEREAEGRKMADTEAGFSGGEAAETKKKRRHRRRRPKKTGGNPVQAVQESGAFPESSSGEQRGGIESGTNKVRAKERLPPFFPE